MDKTAKAAACSAPTKPGHDRPAASTGKSEALLQASATQPPHATDSALHRPIVLATALPVINPQRVRQPHAALPPTSRARWRLPTSTTRSAEETDKSMR